MSQPRPAERIEMEKGSVVITGERRAPNDFLLRVNPVRNSSGALNPAGIIIKPNPAAEQRGIISNGVKLSVQACNIAILAPKTEFRSI